MSKVFLGIALWLFFLQGFGEGRRRVTPVRDRPGYIDITEKNLTFQLFTRNNNENGVTLLIGDKTKLLASGFKASLPTKICTHGFMGNGNSSWIIRLKDGVLRTEEVNFIAVDWSDCARHVLYEQTIICMKKAGLYTGKLLQFLQKEVQLDLTKVHLIGHSLGAHLMYFASTVFPVKKTIGRITGLDPAGPLFEHVEESQRLNSNSAKFVDVIHTCRFLVGMRKPIGSLDFYPNGGFNQPGCSDFDLGCHHRKSHTYFVDSIEERSKYQAKKCSGLNNAINGTCYGESAIMGYHSQNRSPGIYYVNITALADN